MKSKHCVKNVRIGVVLVRIQSECEKMRTRITPNTETFQAVFVNQSFQLFESSPLKALEPDRTVKLGNLIKLTLVIS